MHATAGQSDGTRPASPNGNPFLLLALALTAIGWAFATPLGVVLASWFESEEYSHGVLMPVVAGYILWQQRDVLTRLPMKTDWLAVVLLTLALLIALAGLLAAAQTISQYGALLAAAAATAAILGRRWLRAVAFPLLLLGLAVPLPAFLYNTLSLRLQLWSSDLGVAVIRALGISAFQDGNVIDLGTLQLEVAEACNGIRYLFPLVALACVVAYLYAAPLWKRILVVVAAAPIAVIMNGVRIGAIGYLVEHRGPAIAEGFVHQMQGWMVFMASFAVLLGVVLLLERLARAPRGFAQLLAVPDPPEWLQADTDRTSPARVSTAPALVSAALCALAAVVVTVLPERDEIVPARARFADFPASIAEWQGEMQRIEAPYLRALRASDYLLADYRSGNSTAAVNLYVAWYDSQRQGQAAHSPRSCLPGDGWVIDSITTVTLPDGRASNRAVIRKGEQRQLVYYWFEQRGRIVTNEYAVKAWLLIDGILRNRSDGALIRFMTTIDPAEAEDAADARLRHLAMAANPALEPYLPN